MPPGSLVGANFQGATLQGAIFIGQDLTGASFQGADLGPSSKGSVDFTNTTLNKTCFIGAQMDATDFSFAAMTCTDFSGTSLLKAQFGPSQIINAGQGCRTRFVGSTMDVNAIALANWGKVDFTDAVFTGLSPGTFSLSGQDVTGAMLGCTVFTRPPSPGCKAFSAIDLTSANLTGVDLTGAVLVKAKLDSAALNGATLARAQLGYATLTCARLYGAATDPACTKPPPVSANPNKAANLTQAVLQYADLTRATLDYAVLTGANLAGATLTHASLKNATLEAGGGIGAASVLGADFTGADFSNAQLDQVLFNNVILVGAYLGGTSTLNGTDFSGSIMPGADFTGATLQGVTFHATVLENTNFSGAKMQTTPNGGGSGVNFSCAQLGGANFSNAVVTAATFTAAVLPPGPPSITPPQPCCAQKTGPAWCGTNDATQQAYGPVTYPTMSAAVSCPNGDVAACSGTQWVLPSWQTNLCTNDRTTRTMWAPPDCGGAPGENVVFKDPNLKQCILAGLPGQPTESSVKTAATLLAVSCPARGITDLAGLEQFTNLGSLDLTANKLTQFSLKLPQLQTLKLSDNQLTTLDVKDLNPDAPIRLDAANNQLATVLGLPNVNLAVADLSHNNLTQFDLPAQAQSLAYADLSYNKLTNVLNSTQQDLSSMTQLAYLDLSNNSLSTIGSVAAIAAPGSPTLQTLFLACDPTFQCKSLDLVGGSSPGPALLRSSCADYNTQSREWIVATTPQCPVGLMQRPNRGSRRALP